MSKIKGTNHSPHHRIRVFATISSQDDRAKNDAGESLDIVEIKWRKKYVRASMNIE